MMAVNILVAIALVLITAILGYIVFLIVCALLVDPKKEYDHHSRFYRALLNGATADAIKLLRIKLHTEGLERVTPDMMPLFVGNHISNYDPIVTWHIFKQWRPAFISKPSNFNVPVFGRLIRKCCFMAIDRESARNAITTLNKAADLLHSREVSIGIYPEGTRSKSGELLPFHNGVFTIARKAQAPIVVVAVDGTQHIHKRTPFRKTDVWVRVVDVVSADEVSQMRNGDIGERVRHALSAMNCKEENPNEPNTHSV